MLALDSFQGFQFGLFVFKFHSLVVEIETF